MSLAMVGSQEAKECTVGAGVSNLAITDPTYKGGSPELDAREEGVSLAFDSKEGVSAILSWSS